MSRPTTMVMPDTLRYSERTLWARAKRDGDTTVLAVLERLSRYRTALRRADEELRQARILTSPGVREAFAAAYHDIEKWKEDPR